MRRVREHMPEAAGLGNLHAQLACGAVYRMRRVRPRLPNQRMVAQPHQEFFRMVILGRTGKKNLRMTANFLESVTEDAVILVIQNVYAFIDQHIDRTGYPAFREAVLADVDLGDVGKVAETLEFCGYRYERTKD